MSTKMLLSALAVVAAVAVIAAPQDPSFEYPAAKHVGFDLPKEDASQAPQSSERISVSFRNATIREVLDYLKSQGVNFVVGEDQLNKEGHVNINVVNQPVEGLMQALAGAWNGRWERKNDIWVFHKGRDMFEGITDSGGAVFAPAQKAGGWTEGGKFTPSEPFMNLQGQKMTQQQEEDLKKALQKMNDPKQWEEFQKNWEKWTKDYENNAKEFEKAFKDKKFEYKFDSKQLEEMQKQAKEFSKNGKFFKFEPGQNGFIWDGKDMKIDQKQLEEIRKNAVEMSKEGAKMKNFKPGQGFTWDGKAFKPLTEKQLKELRDSVRFNKTPFDGNFYRFNGPEISSSASAHNLKAIFESLTPAQEEKMKRLGYINYSDLNSRQRSLLGVITDDSWTITYKAGKVNLTIKSDR